MRWLVRIKSTSRGGKIHATTDKGNVIKRQRLTEGAGFRTMVTKGLEQ